MLFTRLLTLSAVLLATVLVTRAQPGVLLTGRVQTRATAAAVPFANIGIKGKNTGTATDENGGFSLRIPPNLINDTLTFSAIGFQEQSLAITKIASSQQHTFVLAEKATALSEVVVLSHKPKVRRIGTKTHNPVLWGWVENKETHDIVEFVKLIPLANTPAELLQAHIFLRYPTVDTVAFRLNFYRAAQGLPAERLIEQTILVRTAAQNGWLTIDLTKYALTLQNDFFIGFEILPGKTLARPSPQKKHTPPMLSYGAQFGGAAIFRSSSLGTWKREPGASLSAYVTVRQ